MKLKKFLLTVLTLALLVSASACNFDTELSFGDPEAPTSNIDKPAGEVTQIPNEEPTEKPTKLNSCTRTTRAMRKNLNAYPSS